MFRSSSRSISDRCSLLQCSALTSNLHKTPVTLIEKFGRDPCLSWACLQMEYLFFLRSAPSQGSMHLLFFSYVPTFAFFVLQLICETGYTTVPFCSVPALYRSAHSRGMEHLKVSRAQQLISSYFSLLKLLW